MILYINANVRKESRTDRLARVLLGKLGAYEELKLTDMALLPLNDERLNYRSALIEQGDFEDSIFDLAKQFAKADQIVIAAPYWDASFPAVLRTYIENIYVTGIVSKYNEKGMPQGLCRAKKLYYVTTAGGPYDPRFSYDYLADLAKNMFGIKETELIFTQFMDIVGNDPEEILAEAMKKIEEK